jgi:hypothetical protein
MNCKGTLFASQLIAIQLIFRVNGIKVNFTGHGTRFMPDFDPYYLQTEMCGVAQNSTNICVWYRVARYSGKYATSRIQS